MNIVIVKSFIKMAAIFSLSILLWALVHSYLSVSIPNANLSFGGITIMQLNWGNRLQTDCLTVLFVYVLARVFLWSQSGNVWFPREIQHQESFEKATEHIKFSLFLAAFFAGIGLCSKAFMSDVRGQNFHLVLIIVYIGFWIQVTFTEKNTSFIQNEPRRPHAEFAEKLFDATCVFGLPFGA